MSYTGINVYQLSSAKHFLLWVRVFLCVCVCLRAYLHYGIQYNAI